MKRYILQVGILFGLISIIVLAGCSSGSGSESPDKKYNRAWSEFEAGDYQKALNTFKEVLEGSDDMDRQANEGIGWCYLMLARTESATSALADSALSYLNAAGFLTDASAGRCIIFHARSEHSSAIERGKYVLSKNANYVFSHYPSIDSKTIRLIIAMSAFSLGDFGEVVAQLKVLNPSGNYDTSDPQALLAAIQQLWDPILKP